MGSCKGLYYSFVLVFLCFHSELVGGNFGNNANSFVQVGILIIILSRKLLINIYIYIYILYIDR